jgi:hypothetical protein
VWELHAKVLGNALIARAHEKNHHNPRKLGWFHFRQFDCTYAEGSLIFVSSTPKNFRIEILFFYSLDGENVLFMRVKKH